MPKVGSIGIDGGPVFIGIDPGLGGGVTALNGFEVITREMPSTEKDLWEWLLEMTDTELYHGVKVFAVIEQQTPRPTYWFDKRTKRMTSSILKSTCLLYGQYLQVRMALTAAEIPFQEVPPAKWQKTIGIPGRKKGETTARWKNRLKQLAQSLFPKAKVTLKNADSLLLAHYCQKLHG